MNLKIGNFKQYFDLGIDWDGLLKTHKKRQDDIENNMQEYDKINFHRVKRILKQFNPEISEAKKTRIVNKSPYWIALTESWCGDSAQSIPVIFSIAKKSGVNIKFLFRDENSDFMEHLLTNGSRSIPKIVFLDSNYNFFDSWGPRPKFIEEVVNKSKKKLNWEEEKHKVFEHIQTLYNKDRGLRIMEEILQKF